MDNFLRTSNSNRYIIDDDFIPKVTSDGEPHEMMTLIAGVSGLIAAVIILIILIILLGCKKHDKKQQKNNILDDIKTIPTLTTVVINTENGKKTESLIPMFIRQPKPNNTSNTELNTISIIPINSSSLGCTNYGYEINQNDNDNNNCIPALNNSDIKTERF